MDDKESRSSIVQFVLNIAYVAVGIAIVVLGFVSWLSESKRAILVPCIYGLSALMCALHMADLIRNMPRGKKSWSGVFATLAAVPVMAGMAALTYVCMH